MESGMTMKLNDRWSPFNIAMVAVLTVGALFAASPVSGQSLPASDQSFPCRLRDGANPDFFMMTLGDVNTPLAQGRFTPATDQVRLPDGTTSDHYFRDTLKITYYRPIDKKIFPLPPSGWCSWYYYYYDITDKETWKNAKWLADNLKDYGVEYVQIDDGWQGVGRGFGENRDWTTIHSRFPDGMEKVTSSIKQLGFKAGLWIAPHGQSNPKVVKANPDVFLLSPDGSSLSETWEGKYLVDPSTQAGHDYVKKLFTTLSGWGFDYFKIDGQPGVISEYKRLASQMRAPSTDPVALYRKTLQTIHEAIGPRRYLLGCWEAPLEGVGLAEGWRMGADVRPGWEGFKIALDATMRFYFMHNNVWYADPDVVMVRDPLTLEQARMWATLQGLTGQALLASDRMMDLPEERVELYRRIFPAVDIRPLDLFPSLTRKPIWDLKVQHLGRSYDVVGLFNFDDISKKPIYLNWKELGLADGQPVHIYDFWHREYLGAFPKGFSIGIAPASCRVLTLLPASKDIQLISTSRHLTQGWLDLLSLKYDADKTTYHGRSRIIRNDPYVLTFVFPPDRNFAVKEVIADGLPVKVANHHGWATVEITPDNTRGVSWSVAFVPESWYHHPVNNPKGVVVEQTGLTQAVVKWKQPGPPNNVGSYLVTLDNELLGATRELSFLLQNVATNTAHTVQVASVWEDGTTATNTLESLTFTLDATIPEKQPIPVGKKKVKLPR